MIEKKRVLTIRSEELQNLLDIKYALDRFSIVAITDKDGTITYVNKEFCRLSGYTKSELIGQNHRILKSGHHPPEFYKNLWDIISKGNVWHGIIKNKAKDGTFYWVKTIIVPFLDEDGKPGKYVSIRTDITKEIELQKKVAESEKLAIIGELTARIAHDLRNPLSVIKNGLSIIRTKNPVLLEEDLQIFSRIDKAVIRMAHQIEEVFDYIKPKPLALENCSLLKILNSALELTSIPDTVKMNLPQNDTQILCDEQRIKIVFVNLLTNAIQAMNNKGQIDIGCLDKDEHVIIEVCDTGTGIPKEILPKIFKPLFTTRQAGTGLGLPSCKAIVEKHGGRIDVKTQPGKGTVFIIKLPRIPHDSIV